MPRFPSAEADLTGYTKIASNSYPGDDNVNRAIAHGLGVVPKLIIISGNGSTYGCLRIIEPGYILMISSTVESRLSVTAPDSTNFYVGNSPNYGRSGNLIGVTWHWVAFA